MALESFQRHYPDGDKVTVRDFHALQDILERVLKPLVECVLIDGHLLEDVDLVGGVTTSVDHKLGRVPQGWFCTSNDFSQSPPREDSKGSTTLDLYVVNNTTVDIWVF